MQVIYKGLSSKLIRAALVVAVFFCCSTAQGQVMVVDATNRPIMPKEYVNLKGSPYLYDDWIKGTVQLANGIEYKDIYLMYDQVKEELNFTYKDGKVQKFVDPVARFTLENREFRRDLMGKNKPLAKEYIEVLVDGNTKLLKKNSKKIIDEINHAVATKERKVLSKTNYFLLTKGDLVKIKNSRSSVIEALGTHKDALKAYIQNEGLDLNNEQDLVKLVAYYNKLN